MDPVIPLADLQPIYSVAEVDRALEDSAARRNESLKGWYDRMRDLGGSRYIVKPSRTAAIDELYDASPNFLTVIDDLKKVPRARDCGQRGGAVHADPAAGRARPRQDVFREEARARARNRLRVRLDELAHRGLGADGRVRAVAQRAAGKGRPDADRGRIRQPGAGAGRSRQGRRRPPLRPDGGALRPAGTRHRRFISRTSSSTSTWTPRTSCGSPPRTTRVDSGPDPEPDECLRDRAPGRRRLTQDRARRCIARSSMRTAGRSRPSLRRACSSGWRRSRRATCASSCSMRSAPRNSPDATTSFPRTSTRSKLCGRRMRMGF